MPKRAVFPASFALLASLFIAAPTRATSETGLPPIQLLVPSPERASPQSFAIAADRRGLLYLGNLSGLFVYDGARWTERELPVEGSLQALAVDERGVLASGAIDEIGLWETDAAGSVRYRSLAPLVPEADRPLDEVVAIHRTARGWLFVTARAVWFAHGSALERIAAWPAGDELPRSFGADGRLYLWTEAGLARLDETGAVPFAGGERFRARPVTAALALDGRVYAGLRDEGLEALDGAPLPGELEAASSWAREHELTTALALEDGRYLLGSRRGGLLVVGRDGGAEHQIDAAAGLGDDYVRALATDHEGGVWVACNTGVARIDFTTPLTLFDARLGTPPRILALARHRGTLWVGAASGLHRLDPAGVSRVFVAVPAVRATVFALQPLGDDLFVGARDGIYVGRDGRFDRLGGSEGETVYAVQPSAADPERVWLGLRHGLGAARRSADGWRFEPVIAGSPRFVRSIVERGADRLWLGTAIAGFGKAERTREGAAESWKFAGFAEGEILLQQIGGAILALEGRIQKLDETTGQLADDPRFAHLEFGDRGFLLHLDPLGRLWTNGDKTRWFEPAADGGFAREPRALVAAPGYDVQAIYGEPDGVVWVAGERALARVRLERAGASVARAPRALVRAVLVGQRSVADEANLAPLGALAFPERGGRLRLELAPGSFLSGAEFQTRLDPVDADWSPFRAEPFLELAGLPAGRYALHVRARAASGEVGPETTVAFAVRPPWYRTAWAYGAAALGAALAVVALVALRTRTLQARAARLESEVRAKTTELTATIGRLSTTQAELVEKNHQLEAANARLERWSLEDELTGLANRRALHGRLEEELSRTLRHGSKLSFVLFDLDHFKVVNDVLGHEEGDRCLERVGGYVKDQIRRRADLAARYGGEEFALVLPDTALAGALTVAENLREGIAALALGVAAGRGALTASFGVAQAAIDGSDRVVDLLKRADDALYRAKREGRDRVIAAPTPAVGRG